MSAWQIGKRKAVHEDIGVSRANVPMFRGQCHVGLAFHRNEGGIGVQEEPLTAEELARVLEFEPRRLCGHCYPTVDR